MLRATKKYEPKIIDFGCGPGNITERLISVWPNAQVIGIDGSKEIVINGDFNDHGTKHLLSEVYRSFVPNKVILGINEEAAYDNFPLAASKNMLDGKPTAYVCKNYTCSLPVNEPTDLFKQLTN